LIVLTPRRCDIRRSLSHSNFSDELLFTFQNISKKQFPNNYFCQR